MTQMMKSQSPRIARPARWLSIQTCRFPAYVWDAARPVVRRRARKPTLAAAIKQASKAGVKVAGAVLDPSGKIELKFGEQAASDAAVDELNEWRKRRARPT
jgi:hypothetical protein